MTEPADKQANRYVMMGALLEVPFILAAVLIYLTTRNIALAILIAVPGVVIMTYCLFRAKQIKEQDSASGQ